MSARRCIRARLSPKRIASTIADATASRTSAPSALVEAIKAVLNDAIKAGGSSLRDHRRADGALGDFQHHFRVYDREGERCPSGCNGKVKRIVQNGRSTFYCPVCQKMSVGDSGDGLLSRRVSPG